MTPSRNLIHEELHFVKLRMITYTARYTPSLPNYKPAIEQSDADDTKGMIQLMTTRMDRYEQKLDKTK
ncbi:Hypothetical predicted protein [Mytilus galloprovincialis]|uniref:Uncharacterized protein n=1 Tax=Mytilus galloprovincialis TaxID=29158 RepID=A0A8B6FYQ1_MYTGA|nr:Hypothetical predicted protein [Mytilus galloprovincialis]